MAVPAAADKREVTPEQHAAVINGGDEYADETQNRPDKIPDLTKGALRSTTCWRGSPPKPSNTSSKSLDCAAACRRTWARTTTAPSGKNYKPAPAKPCSKSINPKPLLFLALIHWNFTTTPAVIFRSVAFGGFPQFDSQDELGSGSVFQFPLSSSCIPLLAGGGENALFLLGET